MAQRRDKQSDQIFCLTQEKADFVRFILGRTDKNNSGTITPDELKDVPEKFSDFILKMDTNKDGKVTIDEIWETWKKDHGVTVRKEEDVMISESVARFLDVEKFFKHISGGNHHITMGDCYTKLDYKEDDGSVQLGNLLNIFSRIDKNKDSKLHLFELWDFFFDVYFPDVQTELKMIRFFHDADKNGDGTLCFREIDEVFRMNHMNKDLVVELKAIETLSAGADSISIDAFIKQWKQMTRGKKYPVKAPRGLQHSEGDLVGCAQERSELREKHLRMLDKDERKVRPEFLKDVIKMDKDKDGEVTFDEMWDQHKKDNGIELTLEENQVVTAISDSYSRIKGCFEWIDVDQSGTLEMNECYDKFGVDTENENEELRNIVNIFYRIDKDQDSAVTLKELWDFFRVIEFPDITKEIKFLQFFHDHDEDGNGSLDMRELRKIPDECGLPEGIQVTEVAYNRGLIEDDKLTLPEFMGTWKDMVRDDKFPKRH